MKILEALNTCIERVKMWSIRNFATIAETRELSKSVANLDQRIPLPTYRAIIYIEEQFDTPVGNSVEINGIPYRAFFGEGISSPTQTRKAHLIESNTPILTITSPVQDKMIIKDDEGNVLHNGYDEYRDPACWYYLDLSEFENRNFSITLSNYTYE